MIALCPLVEGLSEVWMVDRLSNARIVEVDDGTDHRPQYSPQGARKDLGIRFTDSTSPEDGQ